jgi:acetolactate synthase-1/2/3 large subunit
MTTYADVVAATLKDAGIEYIFGVPGSLSSVELIQAAGKAGLRYILCSNESSAAAMAGVYGVMKNRPGVVSTGVGPGAAAAVHGAVHLQLERAPVLLLTDRFTDAEYLRLPRQRVDQPAMFGPVTKGSFTLSTIDTAKTLQRAIDLSLAGRPGPVHVDLPYDLMQAEASAADMPQPSTTQRFFDGMSHVYEAGTSHAPAFMPGLSTGSDAPAFMPGSTPNATPGLQALAAAIEGATRPAIVAGFQIARHGPGAEAAFLEFAEKLNVPVFNSLAAKGTFPEDRPMASGTFRGVPSERAILDNADLLAMVGLDPIEIFTSAWPYTAPVVTLDTVPVTEGPYRPAIEVIADIEQGLRTLTQLTTTHSGWNREDLDAYRAQRDVALHKTGEGLMPGAVIRLTRERLPDNGIITVDAGQHKVVTSDLWETRRPRGFHTSSGLGSMAVSLTAALGAKLCEPEAPVVCFTGDGGMLMRLGDLETAVRENIAVVIVVFNDRALNMIKLQQDRRGFTRNGTAFAPDTDFAAIARGFNIEATRVDDEADLDAALQQAIASNRPWLIEAMVNPEGYV